MFVWQPEPRASCRADRRHPQTARVPSVSQGFDCIVIFRKVSVESREAPATKPPTSATDCRRPDQPRSVVHTTNESSSCWLFYLSYTEEYTFRLKTRIPCRGKVSYTKLLCWRRLVDVYVSATCSISGYGEMDGARSKKHEL